MLDNLHIEDVFFLDIETVPQYGSYDELTDVFKKHWDRKAAAFCAEGQTPADIYSHAGLYPEFGRIVCISAGYVTRKMNGLSYRVKSFYGDDEKILLSEFCEALAKFTAHPSKCICAHNGQEFDYPFIARRVLINGLELPKILDIAGMKPWEVRGRCIDTLQLWKFGDYKSYTSLDLLCAIFGIPTPKDDIDGSLVAKVYYDDRDMERIARYCENDTLAVANLLLKYCGRDIIDSDNVERIA